MALNLKRDDSSAIIQALAPDDATSVNGTSSGVSVRLTLPADSQIVEVAASAGIHWQFGNSAVNATSANKYQGGGSLVYKVPPAGATHLAFIAATGVATAICSATRLY